MTAVATNNLPLPTSLPQAAIAARSKDNSNTQNEGAWQRAFASAAHEPASSVNAASLAVASRLLDLNAAMAAPAAELDMAPSVLEPFVALPSSAAAATSLHGPATVDSGPAPSRASAGHHRVSTGARDTATSSESSASEAVSRSVASGSIDRSVRASPGAGPGKGEALARAAARDDAGPVVLALRTPLARPDQAFTAYEQAMSSSAASDAAVSFTLVSRSSIAPVRIHVQWRGRLADVWIGLQRRAFDQLPDIRAGIQDWVSSRGGVVGRLVCNGERLEGTPIPSSFPGVL